MKILKIILVAIFSLTMGLHSHADGGDVNEKVHSFVPEAGFLPDEKTAILVAEAILAPIYGRHEIESQKPFSVSLSDSVWTISGTLPKEKVGGVFLIKLSKQTAMVISLSHGK